MALWVQLFNNVLSQYWICKLQEEKGYGYFKLERHALNMLIAGPVLWVLGSIHNSCQIYERADGHIQILQQSVHIPFLMGSLLFMVGSIINCHEQARLVHHGIDLLVSSKERCSIFLRDSLKKSIKNYMLCHYMILNWIISLVQLS